MTGEFLTQPRPEPSHSACFWEPRLPSRGEFFTVPLQNENGEACICSRMHTLPPSIDGEPLAQDPVMVDVDIVVGSKLSKLELLFQSHESQVDAAKCSKSVCPACHASACFTRKDIRRRKLRYLRQHPVTSILHVAKIVIRLVRWKCILCKYTFTDYPDFRTPI